MSDTPRTNEPLRWSALLTVPVLVGFLRVADMVAMVTDWFDPPTYWFPRPLTYLLFLLPWWLWVLVAGGSIAAMAAVSPKPFRKALKEAGSVLAYTGISVPAFFLFSMTCEALALNAVLGDVHWEELPCFSYLLLVLGFPLLLVHAALALAGVIALLAWVAVMIYPRVPARGGAEPPVWPCGSWILLVTASVVAIATFALLVNRALHG